MRSLLLVSLAIAASLLATASTGSYAFMKDGCGSGECRDCHALTRDEAAARLEGLVDNVIRVEESPVKGLWVIDVAKDGKILPVYMDYSKDYVISGQVVQLSTKRTYTGERFQKMNKVDVSSISLDNAVRIGKAKAGKRVIVFDNPDCPHCARLHEEIKKVVEKDGNVAFYVKILPGSNPLTIDKARAVVCSGSAKVLEDVFAGKSVPPAPEGCGREILEETVRLADRLGIRGTPTLVLPDGTVSSGYRDADALMAQLKEATAPAGGADTRAKDSSGPSAK
jgi:thiol:disulfide interchange protein DsbC